VRSHTGLAFVKLAHTVVWAFLASCIIAVPVLAIVGRLGLAVVASGIVASEVVVLAANGMRCPLTDVAGKLTDERSDNFDIYLPLWLARNNKVVFGTLFVAGEAMLVWCWVK
jgi:hypothetical protein